MATCSLRSCTSTWCCHRIHHPRHHQGRRQRINFVVTIVKYLAYLRGILLLFLYKCAIILIIILEKSPLFMDGYRQIPSSELGPDTSIQLARCVATLYELIPLAHPATLSELTPQREPVYTAIHTTARQRSLSPKDIELLFTTKAEYTPLLDSID